MSCQHNRQIVFLYVDNELENTLVVSFREHLAQCPRCAREEEYVRRFVTLVRARCCRSAAPATLRERILRALGEQR
jgi:mycothiol system anti-sigma-R factor